MTETESKWAARVQAWRDSGQTATKFCEGKDFQPGGLRYWAHRLRNTRPAAPTREVRIARVVRALPAAPERAPEASIVIELGAARLGVRRGFDPEVLRAVLDVLEVRR